MKRAHKVVLAIVIVLGLLGYSNRARADYQGYVCQASYTNALLNANAYGIFGNLWLQIYSGTGCTGTLQGSGYICTAGATNASCSAYPIATQAELLAYYQSLVTVAVNQKTKVYVTTESGTGNIKWFNVDGN